MEKLIKTQTVNNKNPNLIKGRNSVKYKISNANLNHFTSFQRGVGNRALSNFFAHGGLQAKLKVNLPGDKFEKEADSISEQVIGSGSAQSNDISLKTKGVQRKCSSCKSARGSCAGCAEEEKVHRKEKPGASSSFEQPDNLFNTGTPFSSRDRKYFEPRFGQNFDNVRIHIDSTANRSAEMLNARAFTLGNNIAFGRGEFRPETDSGKKLIAHELTHVMQQNGQRGYIPTAGQFIARKGYKGDKHVNKWRASLNKKEIGNEDYQDAVEVLKKMTIPSREFLLKQESFVTAEKLKGLLLNAKSMGKDYKGVFINIKSEVSRRGLALGIESGEDSEKADKKAKTTLEKDQKRTRKRKKRLQPEWKQKFLKRWRAIPREKKWTRKTGKKRTWRAINMFIVAKELYYTDPIDPKLAEKILVEIQNGFVDKYINDSNLEKEFKYMSGLGRSRIDMVYLSGKSAVKAVQNKIKTGQLIPGKSGEASWEYEIAHFKSAYEVMEVLSRDSAFEKAKGIKALDTLTGGKAMDAFFKGFLKGIKGKLSDEDYKALSEKLLKSQVVNIIAPPVIISGVTVGLGKDLVDALKGLYELINKPGEMINNMMELFKILLFDEKAAHILGKAIGEESGQDIAKLARKDIVTFTYKLGELVGPTIVYTVLSVVTGGVVGGATVSARLSNFLKKFKKTSKTLKKIKKLIPRVSKNWAIKTLKLSAETTKDLTQKGVNRLRMLSDKALARISKLSKKAKRKILGCASECKVDIDEIISRLEFTDSEIEDWANAIPVKASSPAVKGRKRPTIESASGDKKRVPTKKHRRLEANDIPRLAGEELSDAISRIKKVIGKKLSDYAPISKAWERARKHVLKSNTLKKNNVAEVYAKVRKKFWSEIRKDDDALKIFRESGFYMNKEGAAYLGGVKPGIPKQEYSISLDHILEKAQGDNWKRALDADNLAFEFHNPNSFREIVQMRHKELR